MEKFQSSCDKELMKLAMLKQEEIFREQVYELHRLYQVQKILTMKNISRNRESKQSHEQWINNSSYSNNLYQIHQAPRQNLDWQQPDEEQVANVIEDECDIELTLGLSSYHQTRKTKTPQKRFDNSIGVCTISDKITKEEVTAHRWGLVEVPNTSPNGRRNGANDINEQLREDRLQQPPCLLQDLGMNIT